MRRRDFLNGVMAGCVAPIISEFTPPSAAAKTHPWSKGEYLYCDAQLLAKAWKTSPSVAKNAITNKVMYGNQSLLNQELKIARKQFAHKADWLCSYYSHGYSYRDMENLSNLWGVNIDQAKSKTSLNLFHGQRHQLAKAIKVARHKFETSPEAKRLEHENQLNLTTFHKSSYTYCDAAVLAHTWGMSVSQSKLLIGTKIRHSASDVIKLTLPKARKRALPKAEKLCPHWSMGYQYRDMEMLSQVWKVSISQAKTKTALKLSQGQVDLVNRTLKAALRTTHKGR